MGYQNITIINNTIIRRVTEESHSHFSATMKLEFIFTTNRHISLQTRTLFKLNQEKVKVRKVVLDAEDDKEYHNIEELSRLNPHNEPTRKLDHGPW